MIATSLPERLDVDDLTFTIKHRPRRSTIEITVERNASLTVKTPDGASVEDVRSFVGDQAVDVKLERGRFRMRKDRAESGPDVMRHWYTGTGQSWLRGRVQPWARRLEVGEPRLRVLDLGYRWGSAREDRINVHWATLQLRPALTDYVLVHELAHLHEAAHTARFWRLVERTMPDYESRKDRLAAEGSHLWVGPSHPRRDLRCLTSSMN